METGSENKVGVVDRIEGGIAVVISDKRLYMIPVRDLPKNVCEGDALNLQTFCILKSDVGRRRKKVQGLIDAIFQKE